MPNETQNNADLNYTIDEEASTSSFTNFSNSTSSGSLEINNPFIPYKFNGNDEIIDENESTLSAIENDPERSSIIYNESTDEIHSPDNYDNFPDNQSKNKFLKVLRGEAQLNYFDITESANHYRGNIFKIIKNNIRFRKIKKIWSAPKNALNKLFKKNNNSTKKDIGPDNSNDSYLTNDNFDNSSKEVSLSTFNNFVNSSEVSSLPVDSTRQSNSSSTPASSVVNKLLAKISKIANKVRNKIRFPNIRDLDKKLSEIVKKRPKQSRNVAVYTNSTDNNNNPILGFHMVFSLYEKNNKGILDINNNDPDELCNFIRNKRTSIYSKDAEGSTYSESDYSWNHNNNDSSNNPAIDGLDEHNNSFENRKLYEDRYNDPAICSTVVSSSFVASNTSSDDNDIDSNASFFITDESNLSSHHSISAVSNGQQTLSMQHESSDSITQETANDFLERPIKPTELLDKDSISAEGTYNHQSKPPAYDSNKNNEIKPYTYRVFRLPYGEPPYGMEANKGFYVPTNYREKINEPRPKISPINNTPNPR